MSGAGNPQDNGLWQITLNFVMASCISGAILAGTYLITAPYAARQQEKLKTATMQELLPSAVSFKAMARQVDWFKAFDAQGKCVGYILPAEGRGYGGSIKLLVAVDEKQNIIDYKILVHNETPGLGDQTALPAFRKQFVGKGKEKLIVVKNNDPEKIDAITGATITSTAVTKAIRASLELLAGEIK